MRRIFVITLLIGGYVPGPDVPRISIFAMPLIALRRLSMNDLALRQIPIGLSLGLTAYLAGDPSPAQLPVSWTVQGEGDLVSVERSRNGCDLTGISTGVIRVTAACGRASETLELAVVEADPAFLWPRLKRE